MSRTCSDCMHYHQAVSSLREKRAQQPRFCYPATPACPFFNAPTGLRWVYQEWKVRNGWSVPRRWFLLCDRQILDPEEPNLHFAHMRESCLADGWTSFYRGKRIHISEGLPIGDCARALVDAVRSNDG